MVLLWAIGVSNGRHYVTDIANIKNVTVDHIDF